MKKRYNFVLIITTTKYNKDKFKKSKLLNWKRFILHKIIKSSDRIAYQIVVIPLCTQRYLGIVYNESNNGSVS